MVNGWLIVLWVTVAVAGVVVILLLTYTIVVETTDISGGGGTVDSKPGCDELTSGLPDISAQKCCAGQGITKYNYDLAMDVSPAPVAYQTICRQYCPEGLYDMTNDTCLSDDSNIQSQVSKCLTAIKPTNCTGLAKPVGTSYGTLYYGLRANLNGCQLVTCPQ